VRRGIARGRLEHRTLQNLGTGRGAASARRAHAPPQKILPSIISSNCYYCGVFSCVEVVICVFKKIFRFRAKRGTKKPNESSFYQQRILRYAQNYTMKEIRRFFSINAFSGSRFAPIISSNTLRDGRLDRCGEQYCYLSRCMKTLT